MSGLAPFVPNLSLRLGRTAGNVHESVEGSMLSADISGFTALSERLAEKGPVGAEELIDLINVSFKALMDTAYGYGGEVLSFGGDAILVIFQDEHHQQRAADAALAMQAALRSDQASRDAGLTMTVGVGEGPFDVFLVGSYQRELLLTGRAATEVIRLEGTAETGQTLVSAHIAEAINDTQVVGFVESADGFLIEGEVVTPFTPLDQRPEDIDLDIDLTPYVALDIAEELAAFERLGGEHRQMAITFLTVRNVGSIIDELGAEAVRDHFAHLVDEVVRLTDEHGICAYESDIYTDGVKFLLCAGAPINRGEPLDAALSCAVAIRDIETPFDLHLGVHSGRAFGGFLGTDYRRTYTAMGDVANTAARLMAKARPGEVVAMRETVRNARTVFNTEELEPFPAKGKSELIHADLVLSKADHVKRRGSASLVGREEELAILADALEKRSAVVELVGPGGVGKSAIVDAFRLSLGNRVAFSGACTPYGTATPYSLIRATLRSGLDISVDADPASAGELIDKLVFQHARHLGGSVPLLALAMGAVVPPTPEFEAIDTEFLSEAVGDAVVDLFDSLFAEPIVFVLEDLHWVDDASAAIVDQLIQQSADRPWTVLVTRRPGSRWVLDEDEPHGESTEVFGLMDEDIRRLALENAGADLTDAELDAVIARSEGNPLCAIEFARAVRLHGLDALPSSVDQLFAQRIDHLAPDARLYLRTAAVLGIEFDRDELDVVTADQFAGLEPHEIEHDGILEDYGDGRLGFAHGLYRDAAYEGLPYRRRREVHQLIGEYLEKDEERRADHLSLLSVHFDAAGAWAKSWRYSIESAESARALGANQAAADAFSRALAAGAQLPDLPDPERVSVAISQGDCLSVLSQFEAAEQVYDAAIAANPDDVQLLAVATRKAKLLIDQGDLDGALEQFERTADTVPPQGASPELIAGRARALVGAAGAYSRMGDHLRCIDVARRALADADLVNDEDARAQALDRLHVGLVYARQPDVDDVGLQALDAYRDLGQHHRAAAVLNNLGIEAYFQGRWKDAADAYRQSAAEGMRAGSVMYGQMGLLNAAEIRSDQGHWDEAIEDLEQVRRNWAAARYDTGVAAADLFAGTAHSRAGNWSLAGQLLRSADELLRRIGLEDLVRDAATRLIEMDSYRGRADVEQCRSALAGIAEGDPFRARARRSLAVALAVAGDADAAAVELTLALEEAPNRYERALALDLVARLFPAGEGVEAKQQEAAEIFADLDVIAVAAPPTIRAPRAEKRERVDPRAAQRRERRRR